MKPQVGTGWVVVDSVVETEDIKFELEVVDVSEVAVDGSVLLLGVTIVEDEDGWGLVETSEMLLEVCSIVDRED